MITNFKIFEENTSESKIFNGDYVTINKQKITEIWHNIYGKIVNIEKNNNNLFLLQPLCILTSEEQEEILSYNKFNYDRLYDNIPFDEYDFWIMGDFLIKYDTKDDYDNVTRHIDIIKKINKYNL